MTNVPLPATPVSFENAINGTFAARAIGATIPTSSASNGPRITRFPSAIARWAAAAAPDAVSYMVTRMFLPPVSITARLAAFEIDVPTPAFGPVSGASNATRWRSLSLGNDGPTGSGRVAVGGGATEPG